MKTLPVTLEGDVNAALEDVSLRHGHPKTDMAADILRKYVQTERLRQSLQDPALIALYQELAAEDTALAEAGMADYQQGLEQADRA